MGKAKDYAIEKVNAARTILLELFHLLGAYRDGIVIIGGWVPSLLFPDSKPGHIGSMDIDLALDQNILKEISYRSILRLLLERGYQQGDQPFIFYKMIEVQDTSFNIEVDFLTSEFGGTGKKHRTQIIQDMHPRKAHGCELAFEMPIEVKLHGILPGGSMDETLIRVADIAPFILMKALTLGTRLKEKDAYDIYFCIKNYPGGIDPLIQKFHPYHNNPLAKEGLAILQEKFSSPEHIGPRFVADVLEIIDPEEREMLQRDVYEHVAFLLKGIQSCL